MLNKLIRWFIYKIYRPVPHSVVDAATGNALRWKGVSRG